MVDLVIHNPLAARLRAIADREQRQVEEVLAELLIQYESQVEETTAEASVPLVEALAAMEGMFGDKVTDLSTIVNETMEAY
jgi:hypothetical protein